MNRKQVFASLVVTVAGLAAPALAQESQSPIDIRNENVHFTALPELQFSYSSAASLDVINTGSPDEEATIRANLTSAGSHLTLSGTDYDLLQFHFHSPSEHWLNGHEFDMEMHMVHRDADGNLLVVGRWIEIGAANPTLDPIFANLPPTTGDHLPIGSLDLNALLSPDLHSVRYSGSLTTSPYTEPVSWIMLTTPLHMSLEQVEAFEAIFPDGNSREPQPLNDRLVVSDDPAIPAPASAGLALIGGLLAARRRR